MNINPFASPDESDHRFYALPSTVAPSGGASFIMTTTRQIADLFGCTPEQVRAQFARNAQGLRKMETKAREGGRVVNGYTADQLAVYADQFERKAQGAE